MSLICFYAINYNWNKQKRMHLSPRIRSLADVTG